MKGETREGQRWDQQQTGTEKGSAGQRNNGRGYVDSDWLGALRLMQALSSHRRMSQGDIGLSLAPRCTLVTGQGTSRGSRGSPRLRHYTSIRYSLRQGDYLTSALAASLASKRALAACHWTLATEVRCT